MSSVVFIAFDRATNKGIKLEQCSYAELLDLAQQSAMFSAQCAKLVGEFQVTNRRIEDDTAKIV